MNHHTINYILIDDSFVEIFKHINHLQLIKFRLVCKRWRHIINTKIATHNHNLTLLDSYKHNLFLYMETYPSYRNRKEWTKIMTYIFKKEVRSDDSYSGSINLPKLVKFLINKGAYTSIKDHRPLVWAAENGHLDVIKCAKNKYINIFGHNNKIFDVAYENKKYDIVKYFIEEQHNIRNETNLVQYTIKNNLPFFLDFLKTSKVNVYGSNQENLLLAIGLNDYMMVDILSDEPNLCVNKFFKLAILNRCSHDIIKKIISIDNKLQSNIDEYLNVALKNRYPKIGEFLLKKKTNINIENHSAFIELFHNYEKSEHFLNIVILFIEKGIDINLNDNYAFRVACLKKDIILMKLLIKKDANVKADEFVAMKIAISHNDIELMLMLIDAGATIEYYIDQLFAVAVDTCNPYFIKLLHKCGARLSPNNDYDNALCVASSKGKLDVVKFFIEDGVDPNVSNGKPLNSAVYCGNLAVVKFLLDAGADIHINNDIALKTACERGVICIVKYLLEHTKYSNLILNEALGITLQHNRMEIMNYLNKFLIANNN